MKVNQFVALFCAFVSGVCFLAMIDSVIEQNAVRATINTALFFINSISAYINIKVSE